MKTNVEIKAPKGRLQLRLSAPSPVYVTAFGCEALAGFAAVFDLDVSSEVTFRIDAADGVRAYRFQPECTTAKPEGPVFTNIDREPQESHAVAEVTKALRMFKIEQRSALRELRAERAAMRHEQEALEAVEPVTDDPAPVDPAPANPAPADPAPVPAPVKKK